MKKLFALLLTLAMVLSLVACGGNDTTTEDTSDDTATEETAAGSVYYLNFKPEADQAWQDLAALYTEQTGVAVKVVTAASGDYDTTLNAQMGKDGGFQLPFHGIERQKSRAIAIGKVAALPANPRL